MKNPKQVRSKGARKSGNSQALKRSKPAARPRGIITRKSPTLNGVTVCVFSGQGDSIDKDLGGVELTPDEWNLIKARASERGQSIDEWLLTVVTGALGQLADTQGNAALRIEFEKSSHASPGTAATGANKEWLERVHHEEPLGNTVSRVSDAGYPALAALADSLLQAGSLITTLARAAADDSALARMPFADQLPEAMQGLAYDFVGMKLDSYQKFLWNIEREILSDTMSTIEDVVCEVSAWVDMLTQAMAARHVGHSAMGGNTLCGYHHMSANVRSELETALQEAVEEWSALKSGLVNDVKHAVAGGEGGAR